MKTNQFRWLAETILALLIMVSALPASAQEEPYNFELADDGSGYIMSPRANVNYDQGVLDVPAVRECDGFPILPIVGLEGFQYCNWIMGIIFEDGSQLKYIGNGCFEGCTGIEFVYNIPETLETIGDYAFYGCTMLRELQLGKNLKNIGVSCFEYCTSLPSIKLPSSLKVLREYAFRCCTNLQSVYFEDGVNFYSGYGYHFYNNVFDGCENLNSVKLPDNTPGNFIIPLGTFRWCRSLKSIVFPANTYRIDGYAFNHSGLESLDLTTIDCDECFLTGYYTFAECNSLKTVKAKGNLRFGDTCLYTFQWCKALKTITITGSGDDYIAFPPDAFRYCDSLKYVDVYRLKAIEGSWNGQSTAMDSVFVGCKSLERVTSVCPPVFPQIGVSCFDGCESLKRVDLPVEGTLTIRETAFRGCAALQHFNFANITSIGKGSFDGCVSLADTPNMSDVTSIDESAFNGCSSLSNLAFSNLTSIGTKAFKGCSALASISIKSLNNNPPTVANTDAFDDWHYNNTMLEVLDEKYNDFANDATWKKFLRLTSLFSYTEVEGGYSISKSQHALDSYFTDMLVIPGQYNSSNVVAIAEGAFLGLTGLTGVTIPERIGSIGSNAFKGCTNITTVNNHVAKPIYGNVCPQEAFDSEIYQNGNLYVPFGSLDAYKTFTPWSSFNDMIKQGFGERTLFATQASHEPGVFNYPFELTLTNPNETGTIYYYIVNEGDNPNEVHEVHTYTAPIAIPENSCTVWAYISDGTYCSEPVSWDYTYIKAVTLDETTENTISAGVANVTLRRTIVAEVWNTLVLPFSMTNDEVVAVFGEGAQVAAFSNTDSENVNFNITTEGITANVPVLLKAAAGTEYTFDGYTLVEGTPVAEGTMYDFVGSYAAQYKLTGSEYMLYGDKFWKNDGAGYKVKGFRAYLRPKSGSAAKSLNLVIEGQTTGLKMNTTTGEVEGESYNLAGQRVADSYKGLVIMKGKIVIKR